MNGKGIYDPLTTPMSFTEIQSISPALSREFSGGSIEARAQLENSRTNSKPSLNHQLENVRTPSNPGFTVPRSSSAVAQQQQQQQLLPLQRGSLGLQPAIPKAKPKAKAVQPSSPGLARKPPGSIAPQADGRLPSPKTILNPRLSGMSVRKSYSDHNFGMTPQLTRRNTSTFAMEVAAPPEGQMFGGSRQFTSVPKAKAPGPGHLIPQSAPPSLNSSRNFSNSSRHFSQSGISSVTPSPGVSDEELKPGQTSVQEIPAKARTPPQALTPLKQLSAGSSRTSERSASPRKSVLEEKKHPDFWRPGTFLQRLGFTANARKKNVDNVGFTPMHHEQDSGIFDIEEGGRASQLNQLLPEARPSVTRISFNSEHKDLQREMMQCRDPTMAATKIDKVQAKFAAHPFTVITCRDIVLSDDMFELQSLGVRTDGRVMIVMAMIQRLIMRRLKDPKSTLSCTPAPIVSRVHQVLSDGSLGFHQARKIMDTPFPFAYAEMISFFLVIFMCTAPIVCVAFLEAEWMAYLMSLVSVWTYFSLNELARVLEKPYDADDANDLPLTLLQHEFNHRLWDTVRTMLRSGQQELFANLSEFSSISKYLDAHRAFKTIKSI